ncbi:PREDICTED: transcription repressor OFP7-like [Nicotiana attenuata]|uniref:Transcription repressor n=1 Tax=Nicotiana attenuata TaxID=49451 RepID=A0A314KIS0_NICAT|nr:PREDICTED: transcription repressor OFP7-like [Nicotiana attenuata]OIT29255.1 transcription repressor ofp7 [Nicotiana attenuata]
MGKSFKLRFSKVIASFHSCRSKDSSTLPENPVPSNFFSKSSHTKAMTTKLITLDFPVVNNSPPSSFKRHVSETMVSVGCGFKSRSQEFKWEKEDKFHVVSSFEDSEGENWALRPPSTPPRLAVEKKKRRVKKTNKTKARLRMSTSSADDSGILSTTETWDNYNEEEDETETLVSSSRSFDFSTDDSSTDFNPQLETICETATIRRRKKRNRKTKRRVKHSRRSFSSSKGRRSSVSTSSDNELPARLSVFQKLISCSVDGKVKESFAIVKKSQDPYEDFKRSMMEMILEKQMFEKNELEQLLQCFLSLNGKHYHGLIVEAFSEIWETLFLGNGNGNGNDRARNMSTHPPPRTVCRTI